MYRLLFKFVKNKIPKISETELIALRSGNTSIDRDILLGKVNLPDKKIYDNKYKRKAIPSVGSWAILLSMHSLLKNAIKNNYHLNNFTSMA